MEFEDVINLLPEAKNPVRLLVFQIKPSAPRSSPRQKAFEAVLDVRDVQRDLLWHRMLPLPQAPHPPRANGTSTLREGGFVEDRFWLLLARFVSFIIVRCACRSGTRSNLHDPLSESEIPQCVKGEASLPLEDSVVALNQAQTLPHYDPKGKREGAPGKGVAVFDEMTF